MATCSSGLYLIDAAVFIVLMQADERRSDAVIGQQIAGVPRVFGIDSADQAQHSQGSKSDVFAIPCDVRIPVVFALTQQFSGMECRVDVCRSFFQLIPLLMTSVQGHLRVLEIDFLTLQHQ